MDRSADADSGAFGFQVLLADLQCVVIAARIAAARPVVYATDQNPIPPPAAPARG
jgi:hypothetical protein